MDRSRSLNAPPYFNGSNYAFWKVQMRAFLCSIDESVWDAVDMGWTWPKAAKSKWDKAALAATNANSKALNAILCGVSPDEFYQKASVQKLLSLKRAGALMTSKFKKLLANFRPMSFLYHHKGRANHLL